MTTVQKTISPVDGRVLVQRPLASDQAIDAVLDGQGIRARDVDRVVVGSSFTPSYALRRFPDFHQQPAEFLKQTGCACGMLAPPLPVHGARQQIVFIDHAACGLKLSYLAGLQGSSTDEGSVIRHCLPTVWRLLLCMS